MQNNRYYSCIRLLLILMVMAFVGVGCTKEDRSECNTPILLKFRAVVNVNGENIEVGQEVVKELKLYVFNEQEEFFESHSTEIGSTLSLYYLDHEKVTFVCWGNSASDQQVAPELMVGAKLSESLITLFTEDTGGANEKVTTHPDDIFYSIEEVIIGDVKSSTVVMTLHRKVASVNITSKGLIAYSGGNTGRNVDSFSYVFRSGKKHINFTGNTEGDNVDHHQAAELNNDIHESGIFNILPSTDRDNSVEIDIYKGPEIIATISEDDNGDPIKAKEGELLNIHADFTGEVSISVAITPWGEKKIWKEFE